MTSLVYTCIEDTQFMGECYTIKKIRVIKYYCSYALTYCEADSNCALTKIYVF